MDFDALTEQLERIYTPRLALRPLALADAWPLFRATRNPRFNRELLWAQPTDPLAVLERVEVILESARKGRLAAVCAVVKDTGEWVSMFRFQPQFADASLVEMGIWTHEKFWGDQYSFELTSSCIDAAFTHSETPSLCAATAAKNFGAVGVLNQCGLTPTHLACRRTEQGVENEYQEFAITRAQWAKKTRTPVFNQVPFRDVPKSIPTVVAVRSTQTVNELHEISAHRTNSEALDVEDADCAAET